MTGLDATTGFVEMSRLQPLRFGPALRPVFWRADRVGHATGSIGVSRPRRASTASAASRQRSSRKR